VKEGSIFFGKKEAKNFCQFESVHRSEHCWFLNCVNKSFLLLFFKKDVSCFASGLTPANTICGNAERGLLLLDMVKTDAIR